MNRLEGMLVDGHREVGSVGIDVPRPFGELCNVQAARAWAFASRLTQCSADADDVMQDAFVVAWKKRDEIPAEPWPWFCAVVVNCARNHRRRNMRVRPMAHIDPASSIDAKPHPEETVQAKELRASLTTALESLSAEEHEAVALCVLGGLSHANASEATGINVNTVKARVRRGLEHLREKMKSTPGGVEAFLALPALPMQSGSLETSVSRWVQVAQGGGKLATLPTGTVLKGILLGWLLLALAGVGFYAVLEGTAEDPNTPQVAAEQPLPQEPAEESDTPSLAKVHVSLHDNSTPPAATADPGTDDPVSSVPAAPKDPTKPEAGGNDVFDVRIPYPDGSLQLEGTAVRGPNGLLYHGHVVTYYPSGEKRDEGTYFKGMREGTWTGYHRNKRVSWQGDYGDDDRQGVWCYYFEDGNKDTEGEYFDDKKTGTWTSFYSDGTTKRIDRYIEGHLAGKREEYDLRGRLKSTTEYADDEKNGLQVEYNPENGKVIRETHYLHGDKHGLEQEFDPDTGELVRQTIH
ncbi:MAG: sigma-70 family RNA polymerase sigma factor [Planctomycetes bacterium]|nr:sigma-70 family RNA polymerase sigma factor [Planctomycetota bacterium]